MESIERDIEEKKCTFDRILGAKIQPKYFCLIPKKIQIEQRTNLSDTENQIK